MVNEVVIQLIASVPVLPEAKLTSESERTQTALCFTFRQNRESTQGMVMVALINLKLKGGTRHVKMCFIQHVKLTKSKRE